MDFAQGASPRPVSPPVVRSDGQRLDEANNLHFVWTLGEKLVFDEILGEGTYGTVRAARFGALRVAVKMPRKHQPLTAGEEDNQKQDLDRSPGALHDIAREYEILAHLSFHPNVVRPYTLLTDSNTGLGALVMELAEESLEVRLRREPRLCHSTLWSFVDQMLLGLASMHAKCILHGDLKPSNLLLFVGGRLCLSDFGLARKLTSDCTSAVGKHLYATSYRCVELLHAGDKKVRAV